MTTTFVLGSGKLMSSTVYSKKLPILRTAISKKMAAIGFQGQALHFGGMFTSSQARRALLVYSVQPGNHLPPTGDSARTWQEWILGIITTVIVPFLSRKWTKLLKIKDEVDTVVEETEKIVDCVEEVAETVDKVAKDVADHLPEGGQWRKAAMFVEGVAEEVAREAHLVEDFLHDVEEVEQDVDLLADSINDQTSKIVHPDRNTSTKNIH